MWNYPQMYYFESEQVFSLFQTKRSKRKKVETKIKEQPSTFDYQYTPIPLENYPEEKTSSSWELDFLGRIMINTGRILINPTGPEDYNPWLAGPWDEIAGGILIIGGIILVSVY